jgi:hypothetical protein
LGYGPLGTSLEAFLGSIGSLTSPESARHHVSPSYVPRICLWHGLHAYPRTTTAWDQLPSCVTPSLNYYPTRSCAPPTRPEGLAGFGQLVCEGSSWAFLRGYGNINPLSIDYASRPRLRPRLTQGGLAWPWNPWSSGGRVSHPSFATHACILTRVASTARSLCRFTRHTTLPYPPTHLNQDHKGSG